MNNIKDLFENEYLEVLSQSVYLPERITQKYKLEACLKSNEAKSVFLIQDVFGKRFILKTARMEVHENLESEFSVLNSLEHKSIPRIIEFFSEESINYLVREYVDGMTLCSYIEKRGPMNPLNAKDIILNICDAIIYLHSQIPPVIHRDLKPDNIVLSPDGSCFIIDFGIARKYQRSNIKDTVFLGTQQTAPPEQFGYKQTDARADVYSIGVVLFYLFTGSYDINEIDNSNIPIHYKRIISKCVAFSPDSRFSSVRKIKSALKRLIFFQNYRTKIGLFAGLFIFLAFILYFNNNYKINITFTPLNDSNSQESNLKAAIETTAIYEDEDVSMIEANDYSYAEFSSKLIEKAVREQLYSYDGKPISNEELINIPCLYICGDLVFKDISEHDYSFEWMDLQHERGDIADLNDIVKMNRLKLLVLNFQSVSDLSGIGNCPLRRLSLVGNKIIDISPLSDCTELETLDLSGNEKLEDITAISHMPKLEELFLSGTSVSDLSPLSGLKIKKLVIPNTSVNDYSVLSELPYLTELQVNFVDENNVKIIRELNLYTLYIFNSNLSDIKQLSNMTKLECLHVSDNEISSIEGIDKLSNLRFLGIPSNNISDLTPLENMPMLDSIDVRDNPISDFSPLSKIKTLKTIFCRQQQVPMIKNDCKDCEFEYVVMDYY